jgi:hypothetical protein
MLTFRMHDALVGRTCSRERARARSTPGGSRADSAGRSRTSCSLAPWLRRVGLRVTSPTRRRSRTWLRACERRSGCHRSGPPLPQAIAWRTMGATRAVCCGSAAVRCSRGGAGGARTGIFYIAREYSIYARTWWAHDNAVRKATLTRPRPRQRRFPCQRGVSSR